MSRFPLLRHCLNQSFKFVVSFLPFLSYFPSNTEPDVFFYYFTIFVHSLGTSWSNSPSFYSSHKLLCCSSFICLLRRLDSRPNIEMTFYLTSRILQGVFLMLLKSQRCSENKRMTLTDQKLATLNISRMNFFLLENLLVNSLNVSCGDTKFS